MHLGELQVGVGEPGQSPDLLQPAAGCLGGLPHAPSFLVTQSPEPVALVSFTHPVI